MQVLSKLSRIKVKQNNFNWEMFNMFNIIETFQNCFTRELLPYNFSSEVVALHFNISQRVAIFGGELFRGSVMSASAVPVDRGR